MARSPMFPLGMVLFPAQLLPLRVFEPRYRIMVDECLRTDAGFGVVLIERGSEVGGGDVRTDLGTMARIVHAQPFPDGRWSIVAIGTERIRVTGWLDDAPYPSAEIEPFPDEEPTGSIEALAAQATDLLRHVLALKTELGEPVPPATFDVSPSPLAASYQLAAHCPFGPADRLALLAAPGPAARLEQLVAMLEDEHAFCTAQLALDDTAGHDDLGGPDDPRGPAGPPGPAN
jgi:Lon protease-like protein